MIEQFNGTERFAVLGAGDLGKSLAEAINALGYEVVIANSRGPESLTAFSAASGIAALTAADAMRIADIVVLAVPIGRVPELATDSLAGKLLIDACNYFPHRDGEVADLIAGTAESRYVSRHFPGAKVVKAFNMMRHESLRGAPQPQGHPERIATGVAADDKAARQWVMALVDRLGFDPVDAGALDGSWRQQRAMPAFGADAHKAVLTRLLAKAHPAYPVRKPDAMTGPSRRHWPWK